MCSVCLVLSLGILVVGIPRDSNNLADFFDAVVRIALERQGRFPLLFIHPFGASPVATARGQQPGSTGSRGAVGWRQWGCCPCAGVPLASRLSGPAARVAG